MKSSTLFRTTLCLCLISAAYPAVFPALAQQLPMVAPPASTGIGLSYADMVDLADRAPLVANVRIRNIINLKPEQAGGRCDGFDSRRSGNQSPCKLAL